VLIKKNAVTGLAEMHMHDMELGNIEINYVDNIVVIYLFDDRKRKLKLIFKCMQYFSIDGFEPWGAGMYVNDVRAITTDNDIKTMFLGGNMVSSEAFVTEILLNSGDIVRVLSTGIQVDKMT